MCFKYLIDMNYHYKFSNIVIAHKALVLLILNAFRESYSNKNDISKMKIIDL